MDLQKWMKSGEYLPPPLRDFHDQKDVFKAIHEIVDTNDGTQRVNWIDAQIYTIDVFLWFMARRGWTLQRSRKQVEFLDLDETVRAQNEKRRDAFFSALSNTSAQPGDANEQ